MACASGSPLFFPTQIVQSLIAPSSSIAATNDIGPIIVWSLLLIVFLVLMFVAIMYMKKWMTKEDEDSGSRLGFTLGDLRRLHQQGKMSDEEYEKARVQMIAATKAAADRAAQRAAEETAARKAGATDIDLLRARAKRNREKGESEPNVENVLPDEPDEGPAT